MASAHEVQRDHALVQSTHDEPLYAMVELAQISHFCSTFQAPLKLPVFSRTDLQAALVAGTTGDDRQVALLAEVHFKLVREQGAKLERMIQDWEKAVTRKVTDNWPLEFSSNPFDGAAYDDLTVAQRVQVLNALCHWKLESCAEIQKYLATLQKEADPKALEALRATPIGYDDSGTAYWYFGDCCWVYAEDRPEWQSQGLHEYAVEFADAKRIRLSINFDPTRSTVGLVEDSTPQCAAAPEPYSNGEAAKSTESIMHDKMEITTLVDEQIDGDDEKDEPLPITKTEDRHDEVDTKNNQAEATELPPQPDVKSQNRKMDITMLCGSPPTTESPPKPEPMEEDEHDVSEDRFMSTIVSKRDTVKAEPQQEDVKVEESVAKQHTGEDNGNEKVAVKDEPEVKKRRLSDELNDAKKDAPPLATEDAAPPKRRKTRFHDIVRTSDHSSQSLADKVVTSETHAPKVEVHHTAPTEAIKSDPAAAVDTTALVSVEQGDDFDIMCEACQRSYDRRYLDPPLETRPLGEWRCFECLVNDARGWPRRRNPPSRSPKGSNEVGEETEDVAPRKRSSSSKQSKSKSSGSSKKSSDKKKSSTRSSSSSHKKGSSTKKSSKKHKKSSSSRHSSSSSRHREEYVKLQKLAQGRKRERLAIEEERLNGAHLCPVSLDGPTGWRVICSSVDGLRQVIEKLMGGSLEQDRLRGRLIAILTVEEKMEVERLKKREQLWQVLPRRQSSRVAMGRIKSSGDSAGDSDDEHDSGHEQRTTPRSTRIRGAVNGHDSRDRLSRDRESRARRRRPGDSSDSGSESDVDVESQVRSVVGWIDWKDVQGDNSLTLVCSGVVDRLLKEEISDLFARPVDPEEDGCPDYLTVIQQPMDLGTIQKRVGSGFYATWELFKSDVDLVWKNCRQYNAPDTVVVEYADALDEMFKKMRKEAERKGVRKMGKPSSDEDDQKAGSIRGENDEDDLHESSDAESVKEKAKSDSSASEVSSEGSDDSSDAASSEDDDEESSSKRKTRNRRSGKTTSRSARSTAQPSRPSRSSTSSSKKTRPRRRKASGSDSEEEAESDSESEEDEGVALDSDDSNHGARSRSSRTRPRRGSPSSKRPEARGNSRQSLAPPSPIVAPPQQAAAADVKPAASRRNRINDSSDSSSSEASMKGDDSSSSSDSDDAGEKGETPVKAPVHAPPSGATEPSVAAPAPPPPSTPPPPPPPSSATTTPVTSARKPKGSSSAASGRNRASPTALLNPYQSPASSSSYFSSSDSESSAGGSDSSDSD